jgi:hypothetical protein
MKRTWTSDAPFDFQGRFYRARPPFVCFAFGRDPDHCGLLGGRFDKICWAPAGNVGSQAKMPPIDRHGMTDHETRDRAAKPKYGRSNLLRTPPWFGIRPV